MPPRASELHLDLWRTPSIIAASAPATLDAFSGPRDSGLILHPLAALADSNAQGREFAPTDHPDRHLASDSVARKERL